MKVLYLVSGIGPPAGWGTEFIQNLIFELSQKEIKPTIINPIYVHTDPSWERWAKEQEEKYNVRIINILLPKLLNSLHLQLVVTPFYVTLEAFKILQRERFDVIHEFSSTPVILLRSLLFKIFFKTPIVFTLSVYNNTILGYLFWIKLFNFATFYLIPSLELIKNLTALGIKRKKIIYSPPGIDFKPFRKIIDQFRAREKLGLPKDKFIFTYFGSLTKEKGVYDLIRAAQLINKPIKEKINIALFSVWKGSKEHKRIKEEINKFVSSEIKLSGSSHLSVVDRYVHIPTLLAASDAVILPQQTGHGATIPPISIIETLASGKPLITTNTPILQEFIKQTDSITVPPNNPQKLAKTIEQTFKNKPESPNKQKSLQDFDLGKSVNLHLFVYNQIG